MNIITLDFETFWSQTHSLSRMPPTEYVMHPETEIISVAAKLNDRPTDVIFGEDRIKSVFAKIDWSDKMVIGHNMSGFDSMICAWRLGVRPRMWGCTQAMARPIYGKVCGVGLGALVKHLNIGVKNNAVLHSTKGRHLKDFTSDEIAQMKIYNKDDDDQCWDLFNHMKPQFSAKELFQIHMTIEMLVNPQYVTDTYMVEQALVKEKEQKRKVLIDLASTLDIANDGTEDELAESVRSVLASAPKFTKLLASLGVDTPMKPSETATDENGDPKMIPALAKTDQGFLDLQEHDNPLVAVAAMARLSVKSTILETRLQAFLRATAACNGKLPVPLRYCGADTTGRWSGEQYNMQNLPRVNHKKPKISDALRMSLMAPEGYKVIVADLSGIELRVNHFLWQVPYSTDLYRKDPKADLYSAAAIRLYGYDDISQVTSEQRQLEKVKALGLGFGAGGTTFKDVAKTMGGVILTPEESNAAVYTWRNEHPEITGGWKACDKSLPTISQGGRRSIDPWGLVNTVYNGIELPSGRFIRYPNLRKQFNPKKGWDEWLYGDGRHKTNIYGGKMDENIVQALARDVIADNALMFYRRTKLMPVMMVHDELVYIVPEDVAEQRLELLQDIMRTPPVWWNELITWSEGGVADRYGEAK